MYNFTYENQGTNSYLVYTMAEEEAADSMSLGMITNNKIPGLASAMFMQMNATRYMKYNVSSKIPVSQFFSGPVSKKRLLGVFSGIVEAMLSAEEYMLDIQTIILDLDYIYADVASCETVLICLPVEHEEKSKIDLNLFFKNIMFETQFDQTENCAHVTKIINYLNSAYQFSLTDFKSLLEELVHSCKQEKTAEYQPAAVPMGTDREIQAISQNTLVTKEQPVVQTVSELAAEKASAPMQMTAPVPPVPKPQEASAEHSEKQMSLYYLLRHYDKENADIYKAQKAEKKSNKASEKASKKLAKKEKQKPPKKQQKTKQVSGFAIPGQPAVPVNVPPMDNSEKDISAPPQMQQYAAEERPGGGHSFQPAVQQVLVSSGMTGAGGDFGDTVYEDVQDNGSETVIMGQNCPEQQLRPHLIRKRNNEIIPINKTVFRLGRNYEYNDYMIVENEFVGNSHCHILIRDGEYFIIDDNSKNHTYVNGQPIPSGTEIKLVHGQVFRLADEEFEFRLF